MVEVQCAACHKVHGRYETAKEAPKKFVCSCCGVGQARLPSQPVSRTYGRNYPVGHFDNTDDRSDW